MDVVVDLYLYGLPSNNTTTNGGDAVGLFYSINLQLSTRYLRLDVRRSPDLHCNDYLWCEMTWEKPTMIYVGDSQLQFSCSLTRHGFISICIGYGDLDVSDLSAWARNLLASTLALWVTFNILPLMATLLRYYLGGPHYHD